MIPLSMRIHSVLSGAVLGIFLAAATLPANAQCHKLTLDSPLICDDDSAGSSSPAASSGDSDQQDKSMSIKRVILNLPGDQKRIWTSPFHLHKADAWWLA